MTLQEYTKAINKKYLAQKKKWVQIYAKLLIQEEKARKSKCKCEQNRPFLCSRCSYLNELNQELCEARQSVELDHWEKEILKRKSK